MRLRPDRIVIGEVRGPEARDMLKAWNTGHPGGIATVHANSARAALTRIEQLVQEAVVTVPRQLIAAAMDKLSEVQRGVLVAKVYDEMTFAEIAAELDLALSTVKTHYLRAVRAVRDRLERRWGKEELP